MYVYYNNTLIMGNCITISEHNEMRCVLCKEDLEQKYIFCNNCGDRYHYQCIHKRDPYITTCSHCHRPELRCIDIGRKSKLETSFERSSYRPPRSSTI